RCSVARARLSRGRDRVRYRGGRGRAQGRARARGGRGLRRGCRRVMRESQAGLPAVDRVLRSAEGEALIARYGRPLVRDAVRAALDERRRCGAGASALTIAEASAAALARTMEPSQRRGFNLTGTG